MKIDKYTEKLKENFKYKFSLKSSIENINPILQFELNENNEIVDILNELQKNQLNILDVNREEKNVQDLFIDIVNRERS